MRYRIRRLAVVSTLIGLFFGPGLLHAQAPQNDAWVHRTPIASLPFSVNVTGIVDATVDAADPAPQCTPASSPPNTLRNTVWYSYTTGATPEYLNIDAIADTFTLVIAVYSGSPGSFRLETGGCGGSGSLFIPARISGLRLKPNTEYSLLVGSLNNVNGGTLSVHLASAPIYQVNKAADVDDGVCDADCSLREAVRAANAVPGAVLLPFGTFPVLSGGSSEDGNLSGDLDIACGMGIYGAGMNNTVLDALATDRVLDFDPGTLGHCTLILADLTVKGGYATSITGTVPDGGGLRMAFGSSAPYADFVGIERVRFTDNRASTNGAGALLLCPAQIRDSRFDHNSGALFGAGLAFYTDPTLSIEISGSTFDDNSSTQTGGGVLLQGSARIVNSTFSNNHANFYGGGIYFSSPAGSLFVGSSTIAYNTGATNPNSVDSGAGLLVDHATAITLQNNAIGHNTVANPADLPDCTIVTGTLSSHHNHVQHPGMNCPITGVGDVSGSDPGINPALADNGGPTPTHLPSAGSPIIDSADPAGCSDAEGLLLPFDQRGAPYVRAVPSACDKGATEFRLEIFANGFE